MSWPLLFIPLLTAFTAWLTVSLLIKFLFAPAQPLPIAGITLQGIIPAQKKAALQVVAANAADVSKNNSAMETHLQNAAAFNKLLPFIDAEIDRFGAAPHFRRHALDRHAEHFRCRHGVNVEPFLERILQRLDVGDMGEDAQLDLRIVGADQGLA